ncbi:MAG: sulfatase, partial [Candidatus Sumerlaeota bacterium]|nr:sulfatase [Candidatus Sumerlaeota bacterium]
MPDDPNPPHWTRRRFLGQASVAAGVAASSRAAGVFAAASSPSIRPSILFLLTDDQRWDTMGCAGNPIIRTPHMDALAREGARFANAFVTTSICMASRATLFTGLYERTHHYSLGTPPLASRFVDQSYPVLLRAAGYRTGIIGKVGVGLAAADRARMFDVVKPLGHPYFKKTPGGGQRHITDIAGEEAIRFFQDCPPGQPFCLSISFNAPHATDKDPKQYFWPKEYDDLYKDATIPIPETADPAFFASLPAFLQKTMNRKRWAWRFDEPEKFQQMVKGYYRMITHVDAVIGRIRGELARLGLADNTIIALMGDNGYFLGERGYADKWLMYEESIRVPLLVFDPRAGEKKRGRAIDEMALNVDVPPTILEFAGARVPASWQGRSLVSFVEGGKPADWRTDFLYEFLAENPQIPQCEGVRNQRWKYIRYFARDPVYEELYDLADDPHEERNRIADPACRETL